MQWLIGDDGVIRGPGGRGRFGPVCRDDVAEVAAPVLATPDDYDGRTLDITGPAALSLDDVAAELTRACGRRITYAPQTLEEAWASRRAGGAAEWMIAGWVGTYVAIAKGELDLVTDTVAEITGHPSTSLSECLGQHSDV